MSEIDNMRFSDVLRMAEYWAVEPPFSYLYYVAHFKSNNEDEGGSLPPGFKAVPYAQLSAPLQFAVRRTWLKRNKGKTEADFFKAQKASNAEKYKDRLEEARKAKRVV